jgi:ribosomal protein S14
MTKQRMTLRKSNSPRVERTKRRIGQSRVTARPMPCRIHLRAFTSDGGLLGVAQTNDRFMVALFDSNERALGAPKEFTGGSARSQARAYASKLLGRKVTTF